MEDKQILDLYNKGVSIDYIVDLYYKNIHRKIKGHYLNNEFILSRKEYNKSKCREIVYNIIYKGIA